LTTIAFSAGAGGLEGLICLVFTWIFLLARHLMNLILLLKKALNFALLAIVAFIYAGNAYQDARTDLTGLSTSLKDFIVNPYSTSNTAAHDLAAAVG
jgi:hypothetical protein